MNTETIIAIKKHLSEHPEDKEFSITDWDKVLELIQEHNMDDVIFGIIEDFDSTKILLIEEGVLLNELTYTPASSIWGDPVIQDYNTGAIYYVGKRVSEKELDEFEKDNMFEEFKEKYLQWELNEINKELNKYDCSSKFQQQKALDKIKQIDKDYTDLQRRYEDQLEVWQEIANKWEKKAVKLQQKQKKASKIIAQLKQEQYIKQLNKTLTELCRKHSILVEQNSAYIEEYIEHLINDIDGYMNELEEKNNNTHTITSIDKSNNETSETINKLFKKHCKNYKQNITTLEKLELLDTILDQKNQTIANWRKRYQQLEQELTTLTKELDNHTQE